MFGFVLRLFYGCTNENPFAFQESLNDVEKKVLKQLEFYFSDSNFPKDKFLRGEAEKSEDKLSVPVETVLSFKRLQSLGATAEMVAKVAKCSAVIKVSDDGKMVGRINPVDETVGQTTIERTVYVKGWPETPDPTIESVEEFYGAFGKVLSVRLRRRRNKSFKGTMLVEFSKVEEAKSVLEKKPKVDEKELIYMTAADWKKEKEEETKQAKEHKDQQAAESHPAPAKRERVEFEPGTIIHFTGVPETIKRNEIRDLLAQHANVAYVDYEMETSKGSGWVRFASAEDCKKAKEFMDTNKMFDVDVKATILEGEEAKQYNEKANADSEKHAGFKNKRCRKGGKKCNKN